MTKARILLLMHSLDNTGAPRVALETFAHIKAELQQDIDLRIVSLDGGALRQEFEKLGAVKILSEVSFVPCKAASILSSALPRGAVLRVQALQASLCLKAKRWMPDLIYVNSILALHDLHYLKLSPAPTLLHVHEVGTALSTHAEGVRHLINRPYGYIAVSETVRRSLISMFGIPSERIDVVHPFVNASALPANRGAERRDNQKLCVIGGAGRISWCKGDQLWLLMAAEVIRILGADRVRFRWIGLRNEAADRQFVEMARKLKIENSIDFVPATSNPFAHYTQFDFFAMTSWEESASLVTLENMACGKIVFCFKDSGGPGELVDSAGVIIDNFSPVDMAQAIAQLLQSAEQINIMKTASRERVLNNFTSVLQVPKIWRVMEKLMQSPKV